MAQRWDRDRFERARGGGPERDYYRFEEREQVGRNDRQEFMLDERVDRDTPRGRYEREHVIEADRYAPPPRRGPAFFDEPTAHETNQQALAPYRRPRPQFLRRQSSLDTFDRRPAAPRYGDEYRLPSDVPIPLPIRRPASPPRGRYFEEFEERYHDSDDDDYRGVRVSRQRHGKHRSKSRMRSRSVHRRRSESTSSESSFDEIEKNTLVGRKGRTKLPKRLAHKSAVIELGYPYIEDENFIVVQRALDKHHIDKIVEISKKHKQGSKTTYKYEGDKETVTKTEKVQESVEKKVEVKSRASSPAAVPKTPVAIPVGGELVKKTTTTTTVIDPPDHHHRHQDLIIPSSHRLSEHEIRREIRQLEAEQRALRLERSDRFRDDEWQVMGHHHDGRPKEVYRVGRNRKGRMALVRSVH